MKKIFICLFMFFGILSFASWNVLSGDVKTVKEGSWCTGKGSYSYTTKSGGIVRWHESCYINGEEFNDTYIVYYGGDRAKLANPIKDFSKIYLQPGVVIKYVGFDHHYVEDQHFTWRVNVLTFDGKTTIK